MGTKAPALTQFADFRESKVEKQKIESNGKSVESAHLRFSLIPEVSSRWDISDFKLLGIPFQNWEKGVTTIDGRVNNGNLTSWSHHAVGFAVAPSWEKSTLGFPFPMIEQRYNGPELFNDQLGKPNGHRLHWRRFYPEDIREISLELVLYWKNQPLTEAFVAAQSTRFGRRIIGLPYLDELGQVRADCRVRRPIYILDAQH